jgi:biopolymer transport protein ExbD
MKQYLWKKRKKLNEDMSLQITSMADIFTILLVFLLKSYATGAMNITPSQDVKLPVGQAPDAQYEALKVEISEKGVSVEGNPVSVLANFEFPSDDLVAGGASKSLGAALDRERQRQITIAKANSDVKLDPKIIVISDQRAPYGTVKSVLASAALNGYTDFKLAIARGD